MGTVGWTRPGENVFDVVAAAKIAVSRTRKMEQRGAGVNGEEEINEL